MKNQRKKKLINPRLQGRFLTMLMTAAGASVLVHAGLSARVLSSLAAELPYDGPRLHDAIPGTVVMSSIATLLAVLPLFLLLGISGTFRVFGPLYRFRMFLGAVSRGEHPEPCRIRKGDEFQDICELLNVVTEKERLRQAAAGSQAGPQAEDPGSQDPQKADSSLDRAA